jgi:ketosteroid isomerase-like protein
MIVKRSSAMKVWSVFTGALITGVMPMAMAAPTKHSAAMDAARAEANQQLQKPLKFEHEKIKSSGDWAFVMAQLRTPENKPFDYAGTKLADAAKEGMVSTRFVALLRTTDGVWQIIDHRIGPTDVVWEEWAKKYGAPAEIFAID